jgi:endonuclease VIII
MPEGDTIYRTARTLDRALTGDTVTRVDTGLAPLARTLRDEALAGRTIDHVSAAGKHLLIAFSGGLVLRTHMRMNGSWHIYRTGEPWQRPRGAARIVIETTEWVAVAFNVHDAEFLRPNRRGGERRLATLGPDLLGTFDVDEALRRIRSTGDAPMHRVLIDQRALAGIGNVYKSEILFLAGLHPDTAASAIDDSRMRDLLGLAQTLLQANVSEASGRGIETYRGLRRTTGRMNPGDRLWVYRRGGQPCRRCGTPIARRKDGDAARPTYWCPGCQPLAP